MNQMTKRSLALLMVLVMCISLIPVLHFEASAANVTYTYDSTGKYLYNWGTRGTTATFLSPNAEAFYTSGNTYDVLSSYSGGTSASNANNSALYRELKELMTENHDHITNYNETRDLYKYTDCQNGGGKISCFYTGKEIGPGWDGGATWNREHTWPNSKGLNGSDENDIMMLRPTDANTNSSRGNKAYGEGTGYYNPNSASNGQHNVHGDVARIVLYVYVRWGNTNLWGTGGVIESLDILLEWMEEDPVDTWELGRNDAVEAITGTRNVFVDYPEFAFLLFGEDIPTDMDTPSGEASENCGHNNFGAGVVTAATCTANGYTLYTCKTSGCNYSYKANTTAALGHSYTSGTCTRCGAAEPVAPAEPTFVTEITPGTPYKLGLFSTAKSAEYYFTGTMSGYYGATDTDYTKGVDVYAEQTTGGYYLYFNNANGQKQYINLVLSGTYYNFTFSSTATSVFVWDADKSSFHTTLADEICYIGTYDKYVTMGVLRTSKLQDTDYIARFYTTSGGSSSGGGDDICQHNYNAVVTAPTCTKGGYTTYTCTLCNDVYTGNNTPATGHSYQNGACTACGAAKPSEDSATITFDADKANRTEYTSTIQIWSQNGITVTNNKAASTSNVGDYSNPARFYKSSEVIISFKGMTKVVIDCSGLEAKYVNPWLTPDNGSATEEDKIVTIVFDSPVDTLTFSQLSAQARAKSITVYSASGEQAPCTHSVTTIVGAVAATCTSAGHTGKTVCANCNEVINTGSTIAKKPHAQVSHAAKAPTCTEKGWNAYVTCSNCSYSTYTELPAAHSLVSHAAKTPTCTEKGWNAYKTCNNCNYTTYSELPMTDHTPGEWIIDSEPTLEAAGSKHKECTACGKTTETQVIPSLTHHYDNGVVTAPTCTEQGYTTYTCTDEGCGHSYKDNYVTATGHTEVAHDAKAPTCTEKGWGAYVTCDNCDYTTYSEINATGHTEIAHDAKAPTCTEKGWDAYVTCENCDYTTYSELAATDHSLINHEGKVPTCTEIGWDFYVTCENCDYTTYVEGEATGHDFDDWTVSTAPTCTSAGEERRDCKNCDLYETRELAQLDHKDNNGDKTCDLCGKQDETTNPPADDNNNDNGENENGNGANSGETSEEEKKSGCGSVIYGSSMIIVAVICAAVTMLAKKKRD